MSDLDFIKDKELRKTLEDSIEYIYALFEQSKNAEQKRSYQEETYRVIILYVVSAIEAVLLYFYKTRGEKITSLEYKYPSPLPLEYKHSIKSLSPVVIAVQEQVEKREYEIRMVDLINFFKSRNLILGATATDILDMNDLRNTFHFSKQRARACDLERVEKALHLLVHTIKNAPRALEKKH